MQLLTVNITNIITTGCDLGTWREHPVIYIFLKLASIVIKLH